MKIVYHGAGFIGFTGAAYFAKAGHDVLIYDINQEVVDKVNHKEIPVYGLSEFLKFNPFSRAGLIGATGKWEDIEGIEVHIIAVPTERKGDPILYIAMGAARRLLNGSKRVVIMESTVSPGFTDMLIGEAEIKHMKQQGVCYAVAPRRDWFVDPNDDLERTPRVVGGYDTESTDAAVKILSIVSREIYRTGYREAEAVKAFENAIFYHSIIFGFEFTKKYGDCLNAREVLRLQGTHWRLYPLYPSAGVAGYCVPMGLRYLDMAELRGMDFAAEERWRNWVYDQILSFMDKYRVDAFLIYGVSEKEKTRVPHFSPAFTIDGNMRLLKNTQCFISDPDYSLEELEKMGFTAKPVNCDWAWLLSTIGEGMKLGIIVLKQDANLPRVVRELEVDSRNFVVYDCVGSLSEMRDSFKAYKLIGEKA